jgi:hypothetical protein
MYRNRPIVNFSFLHFAGPYCEEPTLLRAPGFGHAGTAHELFSPVAHLVRQCRLATHVESAWKLSA